MAGTLLFREDELDTHRITQGFDQNSGIVRQLQSGTILQERYLIQDVIGVGGMGSVYRARDLRFQNVVKLVAVKEMINSTPDPLIRETIVQNFEREANILAALNHPSISKIFDFFTHDERSYLVLEFILGKDMEALIEDTEGFIEEARVVSWAVELCDVLSYLHAHKPEPIIFRDMKPSNVMINPQDRIVLIDFGIAKSFRVGQKGTMIGTEGYSPPEQYRGDATPLADIYALGATLHHVLTKWNPRLEAPFSFLERPIRKANPSVSQELESVIYTALQYDPKDRFPTAEAMKEALLMTAKKTGILSRISPPAVETEQTIKPIWTFKCEDEIRATAACNKGIVYIGSYDTNIYALNAGDGKMVWKYPTLGGVVSCPALSDGLAIFGSEDRTLYAVSERTGKLEWNFQTEGSIRCSPQVSEGHVFTGSDDGYFYAVNLATNRMTWRLDVVEPIRSTPFLTNELAYFGCETGELFCVDFRGQIRWRFQAKRPITSSPYLSQGVVYASSLDGMVYALDAQSGWVIWRYRMGKGSVSSPIRTDNMIILGSADEYIYCLDANNAREIWRFKTEHQVSGSPRVNKDCVYCGSADGNLYCLETRTGRFRWKFSTGGPITAAPLIVDNVLYIGSTDHIFYAFLV